MAVVDENTKLLRNKSLTNVAQGGAPTGRSPTPTSNARLLTPGRPPLYSVPSTQSLRSLKSINSINDPLVDTYINRNTGNLGDDITGSSVLNFNMFNKLNNNNNKSQFDRVAYLAYYLPFLNWLPKYDIKQNLLGDFLAGISLASFQIPLVMSIATSLAHLPPITGIYSIISAAIMYSLLGCVPVLIVGPSPSTAIMFGQTIEQIIHEKSFESFSELEIASVMAFSMSGLLLGCGLLRFGFLDNVLSRALLKGFIAAMGFIMIVNEFSTELGLVELAQSQPHLTTLDKLIFAIKYYKEAHILTFTISIVTLTIVMIIRYIKSLLVNKYNKKSAIYFPELFLMVVLATYLCEKYKWYQNGVEIVGNINSPSSSSTTTLPNFINPLNPKYIPLYKQTFSTAFLCAILGYFDSTTATKALGAKYNYNVSSNRELIALGSSNLLTSLVSGLPSFGAFGRSTINILAGATTPMATLIMASCTILAIIYLLPLLYFLPECVLALTTTIIGITVLQEIPHDLKFFWAIRGYDELGLFAMVCLTTILWSAQAGVGLGVLVAIVRVIRHSTKSRIQIMGRIPNTHVFRNADTLIEESFAGFANEHSNVGSNGNNSNFSSTDNLLNLASSSATNPQITINDKLSHLIAEIEDIEGVLVIKIPEPLNFANSSDLKSKMTRIERYGSLLVHPSQPSKRQFNNQNIKFVIFDCKGMNDIDSSATQVLYEIIRRYVEDEGITVSFSRVPTSSNVRDKFKKSGIASLINQCNSNRISHSSESSWSASGMGEGFFLSIDEALKTVDLDTV
ncbi:putative sulfate transporter [Scheffersomyces coipomensis]|uniref:putative sulfate transporter n=1 Tax=Scheffersomyces coipomensis TaxID=1788519 RepID=UPI00315D03E3